MINNSQLKIFFLILYLLKSKVTIDALGYQSDYLRYKISAAKYVL